MFNHLLYQISLKAYAATTTFDNTEGYNFLDVLNRFQDGIASTTQNFLIDTLVRFLPIAIPVIIALALLWWVLRRFGVRR